MYCIIKGSLWCIDTSVTDDTPSDKWTQRLTDQCVHGCNSQVLGDSGYREQELDGDCYTHRAYYMKQMDRNLEKKYWN